MKVQNSNQVNRSPSGQRIYQCFLGRHPMASLALHRGEVLKRLCDFDWCGFKERTGFTAIYFLGLFDNSGPILVKEEEGLELRLDDPSRLPSPFALADHSKVNPLLGTEEDWVALVETVKAAGFDAFVDFVGNHTGHTHVWATLRPDFYVSDPGTVTGFVQEFSGDVIKLNYQNSELVEAQTEVLMKIASWGVGVRCDMAHLVPLWFWRQAFAEVRTTYPKFSAFAEAYGPNLFDWSLFHELINAGFDGTYHEYFYRNLRGVGAGTHSLPDLIAHLKYSLKSPLRNELIHYVMNHDDAFPAMIRYLQPAFTALLWVLPGGSLLFNGQLCGRTSRLAHHLYEGLKPTESEFRGVPDLMQSMLTFAKETAATADDCHLSDQGILVVRIGNPEGMTWLFLANLSRATLRLPEGILPDSVGDSEFPPEGVLSGFTRETPLEAGQFEIFPLS